MPEIASSSSSERTYYLYIKINIQITGPNTIKHISSDVFQSPPSHTLLTQGTQWGPSRGVLGLMLLICVLRLVLQEKKKSGLISQRIWTSKAYSALHGPFIASSSDAGYKLVDSIGRKKSGPMHQTILKYKYSALYGYLIVGSSERIY